MKYDSGNEYGFKAFTNTQSFVCNIVPNHYADIENYFYLDTLIKITIKGSVKSGSIKHLNSEKLIFPNVNNDTVIIYTETYNVIVNGTDIFDFSGDFIEMVTGNNGFLFSVIQTNAMVTFDWLQKFTGCALTRRLYYVIVIKNIGSNKMQTIKILFDDVTQKSQWSISEILTFLAAVGAALISLYGIRQTNKFTKKQIDAEVIAKSRINWIQTTRELSARYISSSFEMLNYLIIAKNETDKNSEEAELIRQKIREASFQLGLMFGVDQDKNNQLIVEFLDGMTDTLTGGIGGPPNYYIELQNNFLLFRDFLNYYFKIEWKRATGEYSDDESKFKQDANPAFENLKKVSDHYSSIRKQKEKSINESVYQHIEESSES